MTQPRTNHLALLLLCACATISVTVASNKPHIVVILADDMGWNDVGFRDPDMYTPNIDKLAREGVNMSQSYMMPVCTPSRASFLSGKYAFKMGLQHSVFSALRSNSMPLGVKLLPEHLQQEGYSTHFVGKWHLGFCARNMTPTGRGFESFYGMYNGKADYYDHVSKWNGYDMHDDKGQGLEDFKVDWEARGEYSTHLFTDKTLELLRTHNKAKPLFLILSYQAVHGPLEVPDHYIREYCSHVTWDDSRQKHCAMTAAMDEGIGNVTSALEHLGYSDNLITLFMSDNGGPIKLGSSNWPLRGSKITLWEGGTRAVSILHSKRHLPRAPYQWDGIMHAIDWYPTLMSAAGYDGTIPGIDGVDNWQNIVENNASDRYEFVYNINDVKGNSALRDTKYKLIYKGGGKPDGWYNPPQSATPKEQPKGKYPKYMLFDLEQDPNEETDLSSDSDYRRLLREMKLKLKDYEKDLIPTTTAPRIDAGKPSKHGGAWVTGWCE